MKLIVLVFAVSCMVKFGFAKIDAIAPKYGVRPPRPPTYPISHGNSDIDKCGCHEIVSKLKKVESNLLKLILNLRNKYGSVNSNLIDMKKHVKSVSWYVGQTSETSENINTQLFNSSITIGNIMQSIRDLTTDQQKLITKTFLTESILALEKRHEEKKPQPPEGEIVYTSCDDERIIQTGTYLVQDAFYEPAKVLCVLDFGPGAYTVIQNRQDGSIDFYRGYSDYRSGFGDFDGGEYWLGLDRIHNITTSGDYELFILLEDFERNVTTARYDNFEIGTGNDFYPITKLDGYSGSAGDSYGAVVGVLFSAYDLDLDESTSNCAVSNRGAWWYTDCGQSNLNGLYLKGLSGSTTGMFWETFRGAYYSLKKSRMMVRRKQMSTTTESPSTTTPTTTMVTETTVTTTEMGTDSTSTTTEMGTETTVTTTEMGTETTGTTTEMGTETTVTTTEMGTETTATTTEMGTESTSTTTEMGTETTVTTTEMGTESTSTTTEMGTETTVTTTEMGTETTVTTTEMGTDSTSTTTEMGTETTVTTTEMGTETTVTTTEMGTETTATTTEMGTETTATTTEMGTEITSTTTEMGTETTVTTTEMGTETTATTTEMGTETTATTTAMGTETTNAVTDPAETTIITTTSTSSASPTTTMGAQTAPPTTTDSGSTPASTMGSQTTTIETTITTIIDPETPVMTTLDPVTPVTTTIDPTTPEMTTIDPGNPSTIITETTVV